MKAHSCLMGQRFFPPRSPLVLFSARAETQRGNRDAPNVACLSWARMAGRGDGCIMYSLDTFFRGELIIMTPCSIFLFFCILSLIFFPSYIVVLWEYCMRTSSDWLILSIWIPEKYHLFCSWLLKHSLWFVLSTIYFF